MCLQGVVVSVVAAGVVCLQQGGEGACGEAQESAAVARRRVGRGPCATQL
jgi:hypothetical protein